MPASLLAHAGAGASWQALVTVLCWLLAGLFVLVVAKRVKVGEPGDLVLPIAGIVIVSSLGTSASDSLSDQIGWSLPLGVVSLVGLVLASMRPDAWRLTSRTTFQVTVVAAVLSALALNQPLTQVLHPPPVYFDATSLPTVVDVAIDITSPQAAPGERVAATSPVTIVAEVTGGSVSGTVPLSADQAPTDPEELGIIRVLDGAEVLDVRPVEDCSAQAPCTTLTFELELTPGLHQVLVEFLTATGSTFRTSVFDLVVLEVG